MVPAGEGWRACRDGVWWLRPNEGRQTPRDKHQLTRKREDAKGKAGRRKKGKEETLERRNGSIRNPFARFAASLRNAQKQAPQPRPALAGTPLQRGTGLLCFPS